MTDPCSTGIRQKFQFSKEFEKDFKHGGNYSFTMNDRIRASSQGGGEPGWSARLMLHARWLRAVIVARSGDVSAIDEIYQEVALAVAKQKEDLPEDRVAPWLYRIAVRQALLHRRRLGRQKRIDRDYRLRRSSDTESESSLDPLVWLLSDERQQLVRRAIQRLHAKDAELLMLKYSESWSYHELANHLGISHSAVETRLHRARQRLRAELVALQVVEVES